ncbi:hypothetical protein [Blastococcus sp. TBT05-19]|uniref:hypothetical protein n=1 Tax=Blastococcus sp. TBT05-19 TaxID=2250581 RepID=UPI001314DB5A|nr:hypothetical protein [Blastococcus sp. TBT05-19]
MATQGDAKDAIFNHIVEALEEAKETLAASARAEAIKELALAYRLTSGGTQPGSAVLTK